MITALQKLFHRLTGDRSVAPGRIAVRLPQSAGASIDETMNVEVENSPFPEAERIAASIRDFPGDWAWKHKGYELQHVPTGFVVWVANKAFALAEVYPNGGKSEFSEPERAIIWPAVEAWLAQHKVGFTGRLPKVHIHFANGHWWCLGNGHPWAGAGDSPAGAYRSWSRAVSIQARTYTTPNEVLHVWSAAR